MRPLIVVAEHPALTVGFASVATNVAAQLHGLGWSVRYLGFGSTTDLDEVDQLFPVEDCGHVDVIGARLVSLAATRPAVLLFGRALDLLTIDDALRLAGRRDDVDLTFIASTDNTPAPIASADLAGAADRIVPVTPFAAVALAAAGLERSLTVPIPQGVDPGRFRPLDPATRTKVRRDELHVGDELVIGYFGRNSRHKRPDLALRAFAHLASGAYACCGSCGHLTVAELDHHVSFHPPATCRRCRGTALVAAEPHPDAVLHLHTDVSDATARRVSGGFDLPLLARRLGVADRVRFDRTIGVGRGVPVERLAARMAAVDVHVLLGEGGGWEMTVLETGACGVPNIVTDHAGPATYAAPFARLIPVAQQIIQPWGIEGIADLDLAVQALVDLTDPDERARLGQAGPTTAAGYSWDVIGARWHELLVEMAA